MRASEMINTLPSGQMLLGKRGPSRLQEVTAAVCMLAYGCTADSLEVTLRLLNRTALLCMFSFSAAVDESFEGEILAAPNEEETKMLLQRAEHLEFSRNAMFHWLLQMELQECSHLSSWPIQAERWYSNNHHGVGERRSTLLLVHFLRGCCMKQWCHSFQRFHNLRENKCSDVSETGGIRGGRREKKQTVFIVRSDLL